MMGTTGDAGDFRGDPAIDIAFSRCPKCSTRYGVTSVSGRDTLSCRHCGSRLVASVPGQGTPIPPFPVHLINRAFRAPAEEPVAVRPTWTPGEEILPHFVVEGTLGAGGMGVVYLVRNADGERFAVKKIRAIQGEDDRFNFLQEIWTWIDLPAHPHLVAGRFVRTIGDETTIFAEYVDGMSLKAWIDERRLTQPSEMLDVAIQFAWGLHAAHAAGLVHQDVKPANALLTADRQLKVGDFGLSRVRSLPVSTERRTTTDHDGVTARTGTLEYRSPEQANGQPLTHYTDVWSWGVSVLHLFMGELIWRDGQAAPDVLQKLRRLGLRDKHKPAVPAGVLDVLDRCFKQNPTERWASLAESAEALLRIHRDVVGSAHPRVLPDDVVLRPAVPEYLRWSTLGLKWDNPRDYLEELFRAERRDPTAAQRFLPPSTGSRSVQILKDLAVYDEALRRYGRIEKPESQARIARLCIEKAVVHHELADWLGSLPLYDQAIAIWEELVRRNEDDASGELASVYLNKGLTLYNLRYLQAAVNVYDEAIQRLKALVYDDGNWGRSNDLAKAYVNKANALEEIGYVNAAGELYREACTLRSWLVEEKGQVEEILPELAQTLANWAIVVRRQKNPREAVTMLEQAIGLFQYLRVKRDDERRAYDIAVACLNKAVVLLEMREFAEAIDACDWAIVILTRLHHQQHTDGRRQIAAAYFNKAHILNEWRRPRLSWGWLIESIKLYRELIERGGRMELRDELGQAERLHEQITGSLHRDVGGLRRLIRRLVDLWRDGR